MSAAQAPATFGAWVRLRRRQLDLTQAELGWRAACSEAAIRKIEADLRRPSRQLAQLLAQALELPDSEHAAFMQSARGILTDELSARPARPNPNNLPVLLTSTVDRTHDLAAVTALFVEEGAHLVTLIGPPGIGKTRLSILCGNKLLPEFPDGVWFVDLTEICSPEFFLSTLARALAALDLPLDPDLPQLLSALKDRRLLLILDNFEHIVERAALEVARLLQSSPHLRILATSRIALHIYGEHQYPMPPLSVPPPEASRQARTLFDYEAVQLFVARARQHRPEFNITPHNAPAIVDICYTLEGMPLALELAAASLHWISLEEMAARLRRMEGGNWIRLFGATARDLPARQRTLENVVAWSYDLLTEAQRQLFCRLAVFSGWFDAEAVAAVCFADAPLSPVEARQRLDGLQERSLLERRELSDKPCWRMLEVIHEYADLMLGETRRADLEPRRARHYLERLQAFRQQDAAPQQMATFFEPHLANLHAAVQWASAAQQVDTGLQLCLLLDDFWSMLGYFREGLSLVRSLLALPVECDPLLRADALQVAADLAWQQHDFETSLEFSRQAVELGRCHNLRGKVPTYLNRLGRIYIEMGAYARACLALEEALTLARLDPQALNAGAPMAQLGEAAFFEGRLDQAQPLLEQALTLLPPDAVIFRAIACTDLAEIALARDDVALAQRWLAQAYEPASQQIRRTLVFLCALAGYLILSGEREALVRAARFYGAIEGLAERSGVNFSPFYLALNERRQVQIRQGLTLAAWRSEFVAGGGWSRERVIEEAGRVCAL